VDPLGGAACQGFPGHKERELLKRFPRRVGKFTIESKLGVFESDEKGSKRGWTVFGWRRVETGGRLDLNAAREGNMPLN